MTKKVDEILFGRMMPIIEVADISKAYEFYVNIFGFKKIFENGNPVGVIILNKDQATFMISSNKKHKGKVGNVLHLFVSDVESIYDLCIENNIRIIKGLKDQSYGQRAFVFSDIDGNRIDVGEQLGV